MDPALLCPVCHYPIQQTYYFCPNCGKNLKPAPPSTSFEKQISLYLLSIFLPPFGLIPGVKYLMQDNEKSKIVGIVAIILTIISTALTTYYTIQFVNEFNTTLNKQLSAPGMY